MSEFIAHHSKSACPGSEAIRVLLFSDYEVNTPTQVSTCDGAVLVVDTVRTGQGAVEKVLTEQPDAILMLTANRTPSADFSEAVYSLYRANLTDRVVIMARNPASYLKLAVKARAAALMSLDVGRNEILSALREVRASCTDPLSILRTQPDTKSRRLCHN